MDSLTDTSKTSFVKHVFNFNEDSKSEMLNIVQYALIAIIPIVIFNKLMQKFIPEADEDKSSIELTVEVVLQVIVTFLLLLFIHRIITYIPTYSGEKYADFSVTNIILAVLIIVLGLQTKLGDKIAILVDRVIDMWNGSDNKKNKKSSQPAPSQMPALDQNAQLQALGGTPIQSLPPINNSNSSFPVQQLPDYNTMNQQSNNSFPSMDTSYGGNIMAANDALGSAFGSAFGGF